MNFHYKKGTQKLQKTEFHLKERAREGDMT